MRLIRVISFIVTLLILSAGCNDDVFIEKLVVSQTDFLVPSLGGEIELVMNHPDWMIGRVAVNNVDCEGVVVDEKGKEHYSSLYLKDYGSARYESSYNSMFIKRPDGYHLVLKLGQSFNTEETHFDVYVMNDYEEVVVSLHMEGCAGYSFDRIEYGDVIFATPRGVFEKAWGLTFNNEDDFPVEQDWEVFTDKAVRSVIFPANAISSSLPFMYYDELLKYTSPFEVEIPDPIIGDDGLTFSGEKVLYDYTNKTLGLPFSDERVSVSFDPGETEMTVFWELMEYSVEYTVWLSHDDGGSPLSFKGVMISKAYTGNWKVNLERE